LPTTTGMPWFAVGVPSVPLEARSQSKAIPTLSARLDLQPPGRAGSSVNDKRPPSDPPRVGGSHCPRANLTERICRSPIRKMLRVSSLERRIRAFAFHLDLKRLNDALAGTPLEGRYWVWGSLLRSWAEGRRFGARGIGDADFGIGFEDAWRFEEALPALISAGFRRGFRFESNDGQVTQHSLFRHGMQFDFFFFFPIQGSTKRRFYAYSQRVPQTSGDWRQLEGELPDQPLESFVQLGRIWWKPKDHELVLEAVYGDWRSRKGTDEYPYHDDGTIVTSRPWHTSSYIWS
jgi:hypothetical protein